MMSQPIFRRQVGQLVKSYLPTLSRPSSVKSRPMMQAALLNTSAYFPAAQRDVKLFTPGPLGTSETVKKVMLKDFGSRDVIFVNTVKKIRSNILQIAGVSEDKFTCVPMQGSGTFAVESVFQTLVPRQGGKVLIFENGVYGRRMKQICDILSIPNNMVSFPEDSLVTLEEVEKAVKGDNSYTHVAIIHCETTSGVINPVEEVGQIVKKHIPGCTYFVDAMSSFGAVPVDFQSGNVDVLVSSANKCLEGVPGFSFVVVNKDLLEKSKGQTRSLSLDLQHQCENLDKSGQFRFTPATHSMVAFSQALDEFFQEGGVKCRGQRYAENSRILREGMKKMGFQSFLTDDIAGFIISSFFHPDHPNFDFTEFYNRLNEKGDVIYPASLVKAKCFRIGSVGHLFPRDMERLVADIRDVCRDMKIDLPL